MITALCCVALLGQTSADTHFRTAADHARANDLTQSLQDLKRSFDAGYAKPSRVLSDAAFQPLITNAHTRASLRTLLAQHVRESEITLIAAKEPGTRIRIEGTLLKQSTNKPVPDRTIFFYQTDEGGRYNHESPSGGMGSRNPRLFGYLKTDRNGKFILHTVRPGSYPGTDAFQHIHFEVDMAQSSEFLFDDDPLLSADGRKTATAQGWPILKLSGKDGERLARTSIFIN